MNHQKRNLRICTLLLILNLVFIWGNSMLPAEISQSISDCVMEWLPDVSGEPVQQEEESHLIRKLAHFSEFTILGFLLSWSAMLLGKKRWSPFPVGIAAACIDETIQMFVPDRGPGLLDVGIDSCGVLMGMILLNTAYFLMRKRTK